MLEFDLKNCVRTLIIISKLLRRIYQKPLLFIFWDGTHSDPCNIVSISRYLATNMMILKSGVQFFKISPTNIVHLKISHYYFKAIYSTITHGKSYYLLYSRTFKCLGFNSNLPESKHGVLEGVFAFKRNALARRCVTVLTCMTAKSMSKSIFDNKIVLTQREIMAA